MPQNYNGSAAGIVAHAPVVISEPVGTDQRNAASVQTPLRQLANAIQYLQENAALLDELAAQLAAEANARQNADAAEATARGNADTAHANLTAPHAATSAATANRLALRDANGRVQIAAPAADLDAANKAYVDTAMPATVTYAGAQVITPAAGWNTPDISRAAKRAGLVQLVVNVQATQVYASGTTNVVLGTLPVGLRPAQELRGLAYREVLGMLGDLFTVKIGIDGTVVLDFTPAIASGDYWTTVSLTFVAA